MTKQQLQEQIREADRRKYNLRKELAIKEDFSDGEIIPLRDWGGIVPNRSAYPDTAVIHKDSETIFDIKAYEASEVEECFFKIESMIHQIKYLTRGNIDASKQEELFNAMEALNSLKINIAPYYNSMVKALKNKNNNGNKNNSSRDIGGIGINSSMYR